MSDIALEIGAKLLPIVAQWLAKHGLKKLDEVIDKRQKQQEEEEKKRQEEETKRRLEEEKKKKFIAGQMDPKEEMGLSPDQLENFLQCGGSRAGYLMGLQCYQKGNITGALTYFIRGYNLDHNIDCALCIAKIQMEEREFSKALPFLEECLNHLKANQRGGQMMFNICEAIWVCHVNIGGEEHIKAAIPLLENSARCGVLVARMELATIYAKNDKNFLNLSRALELCQVVVQQIASQPMVNQEMVTNKMNPTLYCHYFQLMIGQLILKLDRDPLEAIQHLKLAMNGEDETINGEACFHTAIAYKRLKDHAHEMKESCKSHKRRSQWKEEEEEYREKEKHFMRMGRSCGNTKCMTTSKNARYLLAAAQHDFQAMYRYGHLIQKKKPREGARYIKQAAINGYQPTEEDKKFVNSPASDDESDSESERESGSYSGSESYKSKRKSKSESTSDSESGSDRESESESESESTRKPKRKLESEPKRRGKRDSDSESEKGSDSE